MSQTNNERLAIVVNNNSLMLFSFKNMCKYQAGTRCNEIPTSN